MEGDPAKQALKRLQELLQQDPDRGSVREAMTIGVPDDLASDRFRSLRLDLDQRQALVELEERLKVDQRFEHLVTHAGHDQVSCVAKRFACRCAGTPGEDCVPDFFAEHAHEPVEETCFFPVEFLAVEQASDVYGLPLLPVDDDRVPAPNGWFRLDPPVGSVLCVSVSGTNLRLMKRRATESAIRALRAFRVALREDRSVTDLQLRFRLGEGYSFGGRGTGWQAGPDARVDLTLDAALLKTVAAQPLRLLAGESQTDIEQKAARALKWFEEGMLEPEPTVSLLFTFFALEALLGVKGEKKKGPGLAYRRAILGSLTRGKFANPDRIASLYGDVRSAAVHGSAPKEVSAKEALALQWDVRRAIVEFLDFGKEQGLVKRATLLKRLRESSNAERIRKGLLEHGDKGWKKYFEGDSTCDCT